MKKILFLTFFLALLTIAANGQELKKFVTYYACSAGDYDDLKANKVSAGDLYNVSDSDGYLCLINNAHNSTRFGIGTSNPLSALHLYSDSSLKPALLTLQCNYSGGVQANIEIQNGG